MASATPPAPSQIITGQQASLELYFTQILQGRVGIIRVNGNGISAVSGTFLSQEVAFFLPVNEFGYVALLSIPLDVPPRDHPLSVQISYANLTQEVLEAPIRIAPGGFIVQEIIVVGEANKLLDRTIEDAELAQLFALTAPITPIQYWDAQGFRPPVNAELTSPFGAQRTFNGIYQTIHTGWDYQAAIGRPMVASANGQVVFADRLPIRGNYVLIDHGQGVYSGYAHLSVSYVTQGQIVIGGQVVGQVGSTGRSSSAHAHFEMIINNRWVDPVAFMLGYIPN